nr:hypothetical protein [Duganella dendranthematis]
MQPHHAARLQYLLTALDSAKQSEEMNESGFHLHLLSKLKFHAGLLKSMQTGG